MERSFQRKDKHGRRNNSNTKPEPALHPVVGGWSSNNLGSGEIRVEDSGTPFLGCLHRFRSSQHRVGYL